MSQKSPVPGPLPSAAHETSSTPSVRTVASSKPQGSNSTATQSFHAPAAFSARPYGDKTSPPSAQQLDQGKAQDRPEPVSSRTLGVQSILNPSLPEALGTSSSIRNPGAGEYSPVERSPFPAVGQTTSLSSPHILKQSLQNSPLEDASSTTAARPPRRVLTPRSLRTTGPGSRRTSTASSTLINPSLHTSGRGRIYTAEPGLHSGAEIPPLPTAANVGRPTFTYHPSDDSNLSQARHAGDGREDGSGSLPVAPSAKSKSPSTSPVMSYSNPLPALNQYHHTQSNQRTSLPHGTSSTGHAEPQYDMSQGSYEMTLDTERGPMIVPVKVDLQQASKVADEKRKRNAGASARFRERRKTREKEAANTIAGLEKDIRDITDERDFYLNERNFFRDFVTRSIGPSQFPPRPPSPQSRRLPPPPLHEGTAQPWQDPQRERVEQPLKNPKQRRTGEYQPSFATAVSGSPMLPTQPPGYGTPLQGPPPPFPPSFPDARSSGGPTPPQVPHPPRSTSYDPFRRDPYDRSWNPGR